MDEFELISWIREKKGGSGPVTVGPGDDCALISNNGRDIAVSTDSVAEGIHFTADTEPYRIGWKAAASSLSDIAAAACEPVAVFTAAQIPKGKSQTFHHDLYRGIEDVCRLFSITVAGGDLSVSPGGVILSVTSVGFVPEGGMVLRSGAHAGDAVMVSGALGDSSSGKHLEFTPRIEEALLLRKTGALTSMIDISDGLLSELNHISRESGVGIAVDLETVPLTDSLKGRYSDPKEHAIHALCDGEDYELLFTVVPEKADDLLSAWDHKTPITRIGTCGSATDRLSFVSDTFTINPEDLKTYSHGF